KGKTLSSVSACCVVSQDTLFRSSPRKRGPSPLPWIPAFAGMSGVLLFGPTPAERLPAGSRSCIAGPGEARGRWLFRIPILALRRGHVAEWLRNGLQNRVPRFNSGRGLQINQRVEPSAAAPKAGVATVDDRRAYRR